MNRSKYIFADQPFVQNNSVFKVVSFPGHERHFQVPAQSKLSVLRSKTFGQDIAFGNFLSQLANRTQVDGCILVGFTEFRNVVSLDRILKTGKLFLLRPVVFYLDGGGIHVNDLSVSFGHQLCTGIFNQPTFYTGGDNRSFIFNKRNRLTHHVRPHKCAVGIVVLKERYK